MDGDHWELADSAMVSVAQAKGLAAASVKVAVAAERKRCMKVCRDRARAWIRLYRETGDGKYLERKSEAICCEKAIEE